MHKYLRAVGFSSLRKSQDFEVLIKSVFKDHDSKKIVNTGDRVFAEFSKEFAKDCGIAVCGELDDENDFHVEYCFPYLNSSKVSSSEEEVMIEGKSDKDGFVAGFEDLRLNLTMIFSLSNAADYYESAYIKREKDSRLPVYLSALSTEGKILLPVFKSERQVQDAKKKHQKKKALMTAAQKGDEAALEILAIEEMDAIQEAMKRACTEDIYSIVDNNFMPYGLESDVYSIIGDIVETQAVRNRFTGEKLYKMSLLCNDMPIEVCINALDLLGEPEVGRRFKGIVTVQGRVEFN